MLITTNLPKKSSEVPIKTRSPPASFSFKGQATKHKTVKWYYQDEGRFSGVVDQRPQTQVLHWQDLFSAALDLLQECEQEWNTVEEGVGENIQIRLEYLIVTLQQVLPFVGINNAVLNEMLGNIHLLHGQWTRHDLNCTNLAVFSLNSPEAVFFEQP